MVAAAAAAAAADVSSCRQDEQQPRPLAEKKADEAEGDAGSGL